MIFISVANFIRRYNTFYFERYEFKEDTSSLHLYYSYDSGPTFEEVIRFPLSELFTYSCRQTSRQEVAALDRAFRLIFLLSGVSYYKAYIPQKLKCLAFSIDTATATFLEKVYRNGLGEFAYCNNVELDFEFEAELIERLSPFSLNLSHRYLVPVGGGKDSIVTIECLKQQAKGSVTAFAVGTGSGVATPIVETIARADVPSIIIERIISKNLFELNNSGALNGHVPITAIISSIAVACAILCDFDSIVLSNENSANAPNIIVGKTEVNHQYSKSLAFERDFLNFIHSYVSPDLNYFSFLRPLTEVEIVRRFASLENYHSVFRSCNAAFRQDEQRRGKNWCCKCPKCRFVFLALAPFLPKEKLINIFGENLLSNESQIHGFEELCGISSHKPFECVGEIEESRLLIGMLYLTGEWKDEIVVAQLGRLVVATEEKVEEKYHALFINRAQHLLSDKYLEMLDAC